MDDEIFHFEDDDEYQTSNGGERDEEIENQTWEGRNKRQIDPEEQASRNIPADLFMNKINLLNGPTVKIVLNSGSGSGTETLVLPKALLCARSPFFVHAFNGNCKESTPQEIQLPEISITVFQLIIQFLYTDTFTFPNSVLDTNEKLTLYLDFFTSCNKFSITGLALIISRFKSLLKQCSSRGNFPNRSHMQSAISLPPLHEARKLAIAACVRPYACSITKSSTCYGRALFHLEEYMNEENIFAADLFRAYTKAVKGALGTHTIMDPLTMAAYTITTGVACQVDRSRERCASHLGEFY